MKTIASAEREARAVLNKWAVAASAVGWVPGSMFVLAAADVKIVGDIAGIFGVQAYSLDEVSASVGASVMGKVVAGELLSLFPGIGWLIKSGVAGAVTKGMGEAMIKFFRARSPYPF